VKNTYVFTGQEELLKDNALKDLKSATIQDDSINFDIFYGQNATAREIINSARTLPYFSQKRLIALKGAEDLSEEDTQLLIGYIKNPNQSTVLVIFTDDEAYLKKYIKPLGDMVEIKYFRHPDRSDMDSWIKNEFSKSNKSIKPDAARLLKENAGNDLAVLSNEIEKLVIYTGQRNTIEKQDVEELVGRSNIQTGFELVNAISGKSPDKALVILRGLFKSDRRGPEIIGMLAWYLRRLQKGKELMNQNAPQSAISEKLKVPHWILDDFIRQVKSLSEKDINKSLSLLLECDLNIKTGKVKEEQALEFLVAELSC